MHADIHLIDYFIKMNYFSMFLNVLNTFQTCCAYICNFYPPGWKNSKYDLIIVL